MKITLLGGKTFEGTLEETADFTANDGDKFTTIIDATWSEESEKTSFGSQHYEFDIICTKPSNIEITPKKAFGGSIDRRRHRTCKTTHWKFLQNRTVTTVF